MNHTIKAAIFVTFMIFFMTSCEKDGPVVDPAIIPLDTTFCGYINDEKFENTRWQIDSFLKSLPRKDDLNSIDSLVKWLNQKDCVVDAKVRCYGCQLSLPEQSVIFLKLRIKDQLINAILTIGHFDPIRLAAFYKF